MKRIDVRFDNKKLSLIKAMAGKTLTKYKCDPFEFSTAVYGIVGVCIDDSAYVFTNRIQVMDYYGALEDVAVFKIDMCSEKSIQSLIKGNTMIEMPVNKVIKEIDVVNEHQELFKNNEKTYDVYLTRGIIFRLEDGTEISLEKNVWFSEMITVDKGNHLLEKFTPVQEFTEDWEGDFRANCSREILKISRNGTV